MGHTSAPHTSGLGAGPRSPEENATSTRTDSSTAAEAASGRLPARFVGAVSLGTVLQPLMLASGRLGLPNGFNAMGHQSAMYADAPADATGAASGRYRTAQYVGAILASALTELAFSGPAGDAGLHRLGMAVAAIAAVLLLGAAFSPHPRRTRPV